ncbi:MAG: TAXI family TRAP transporter solute-binding subunit [Woeseiaceae bacterium]
MMRLILITALVALTACERNPHELRLVTPLSPIDRGIVEDLGGLFDEKSLVRVQLSKEALSEEAALDAVSSGRADIALISNNLEFRQDIATVMPLYPTVLHIAYRKGRDSLEGPDMLRDAAVFAGSEGSASRLVFENIVKRIGLEDEEYRYVNSPEDIPDVVIVFAPISPERIAEYPNFMLSSMGTPEEIGAGGIIDAAVLLNPHYRPFVIPVGTYNDSTPEPVVTIAVDKILVARSDLDATIVYDLINEILRLRPALAAKRPGLFQQLSDDFDTSRSTFVVHAGTQAYLQRSAPSIYERYSGVAEVAVTLIVALASAIIAGVRIFRLRRKNRIDKFYTRTIELGRSVTDDSSAEDRQRVFDEVRGLQDAAFDLLVNEKLAADDSFRIFITLSDDVLGRLADVGGG